MQREIPFTISNEDRVCFGQLRDFGAVDLKIVKSKGYVRPELILENDILPEAYQYLGQEKAARARFLIGSPLKVVK